MERAPRLRDHLTHKKEERILKVAIESEAGRGQRLWDQKNVLSLGSWPQRKEAGYPWNMLVVFKLAPCPSLVDLLRSFQFFSVDTPPSIKVTPLGGMWSPEPFLSLEPLHPLSRNPQNRKPLHAVPSDI